MIDTKKIESKIDSMDALCEKGRKQVKELVRELFPSAEWDTRPEPKVGQVWRFSDSGTIFDFMLMSHNGSFGYVRLGFISNDFSYGSLEGVVGSSANTFLAHSLEEYYAKKAKGEL